MKIVLMIFVIFTLNAHARPKKCTLFLSYSISRSEIASEAVSASSLISYMDYLFEQRVINVKDLEQFLNKLKEQNLLSNPVAHVKVGDEVVFTESYHQIHYENLERYLRQDGFDKEAVTKWAEAKIHAVREDKQRRDQTKAKTEVAGIEMKFHRVAKGDVEVGEGDKIVSGELLYDIEVMSTKVTQLMWVKEMGQNPARFKDGNGSVTVTIGNHVISMRPDNPVERVTWYSAVLFANHLSRKYRLTEVYDFSRTKQKPGTSVEHGTYDIESGKVQINIEANGFRLPSLLEQKFLLTARGTSSTKYFTGVDEKNINKYAWSDENSEGQTHPVAELKPFIIDGNDFYDLYGNVWEMANDSQVRSGDSRHFSKVIGGSWCQSANSLRAGNHGFCRAASDSEDIGFRLVRTVK